MDAGPTKIHIQQTRAEYEPYPDGYPEEEPPPPPPKKKKRPSHGRGPVWLFLDEEWKRKVDAQQEIYHKEMEARMKRKIKAMKLKKEEDHNMMIRQVGPDWFQELSPNQLITVDGLGDAIKRDLANGTLLSTQNCLAMLGLLPRPHRRHIEIAMKHCCEDPIEFILTVYHLTKSNRKAYSLNDRLLLSSIVHLSMRSVLRELHVRIPSPPRKYKPSDVRKQRQKTKKKQPHIKRKSPYLVPYTFVPEPPKHTGIYKNCHIQYPESPYFSYLDELREEIAKCTQDETGSEGDDFTFSNRHKRPSGCNEISAITEDESTISVLEREIDEELKVAQKKYNKLPHNNKPRKLLRPSIYRPCIKSIALFNYLKAVDRPEQFSKAVGDDIIFSSDTDNNVTEDNTSKCEYLAKMEEQQLKFVIVGIALGKHGEPIPIISGVVLGKVMDCKCTRKKIAKTLYRNKNIEYPDVKDGECHCEEKKKQVEEECDKILGQIGKCTCWPDLLDNTSSSTLSISNIGSYVRLPSDSDEDKKEKLLEVEPPKPFACGCKEIVDIVLDCAERQIECREDCSKKKRKPTFIIADMKLDEAEDSVPIIVGVKAQQRCDCIVKFQRKIAKFEELRIRQEVQDTLKSCKKKFLITGITTGPNGKPVYILSGTSEEKPCPKCEEMIEWKKREEERIANMPTSSQFPQKFVISGVHHSPVGNVYVLTGVAPTKECECMKLYNAYMERHAPCMDLYERYIAKMKKDAEEYLSELTGDENEQSSEKKTSSSSKSTSIGVLPEGECYGEKEPTLETNLPSTSSEREKIEDIGISEENGVDEDNGLFIHVECGCDDSDDDGDENTEMKRFIVMEEIPCSAVKQMAILKRAIASLARDGFPLAKLPEAHRLPHFHIWMALRCGKHWTMEDRRRLHYLSRFYWHHLDYCNTIVRIQKLKISEEQANRYTWANAKYVKKMTSNLVQHYYRKVRQGIIEDGREYFPSMMDYQLPTKTFRDCYFAYVSNKEEAVFANRPWKVYEFIDYKLIRAKNAEKKCLK
ncbi:hypothetical protein Trydic_g11017 [Trypoxylus dichotomus]